MSHHSSSVQSIRFKNGLAFHGPLEFIIQPELRALEDIPTHTPSPTQTDQFWMFEAFRESLNNSGLTNPNPSVGCILIDRNGKELARGATQAFPGLHAERVAFSKITHPDLLKQGTAYITLEPCTHHGNQPPCIDLLTQSSLERVVISRADSDPRVSGRGIQKLLAAGKKVEVGLLKDEVTAWNFAFFAELILKRPVFILKWAQTLDGQLADDLYSSKWISGKSSRAYTHWMRQRHDGILIGAQTLIHDFPSLNVRDCAIQSHHQPTPIIWDLKGRLLVKDQEQQKQCLNKLLTHQRKLIYITADFNTKLLADSILPRNENIFIIKVKAPTDPKQTPVNSDLISKLSSEAIQTFLGKKLQSIFIEGGAQTLRSFIEAGYADSIHAFIAPIITGGNHHRISLGRTLNQAQHFTTIGSHQFGQDTLIEMVSNQINQSLFETNSGETVIDNKDDHPT